MAPWAEASPTDEPEVNGLVLGGRGRSLRTVMQRSLDRVQEILHPLPNTQTSRADQVPADQVPAYSLSSLASTVQPEL